jgi:hypothetical protein
MDSAEINIPAPNAIMVAIALDGILTKYPTKAPISKADPLTKPQNPACNQTGNIEPLSQQENYYLITKFSHF